MKIQATTRRKYYCLLEYGFKNSDYNQWPHVMIRCSEAFTASEMFPRICERDLSPPLSETILGRPVWQNRIFQPTGLGELDSSFQQFNTVDPVKSDARHSLIDWRRMARRIYARFLSEFFSSFSFVFFLKKERTIPHEGGGMVIALFLKKTPGCCLAYAYR